MHSIVLRAQVVNELQLLPHQLLAHYLENRVGAISMFLRSVSCGGLCGKELTP